MRRAMAWLLAVTAAVGLTGVGTAEAGPGSARRAIVALGDSFASGEGGRWLGNGSEPFGSRSGTDRAAFACGGWIGCRHDPRRVYGDSEGNGCHRSDVAPILSAPIAAAAAINLACSGARTRHLWRAQSGGERLRGEQPQSDRLRQVARRHDIGLIVVTAGANDVGFGATVARCALDWARSSPAAPRHCRRRAQAEIEARLPAMRRGLAKALREARAAMAASGHRRGEYRLLTMGYASPLPAGGWIRYPEDGWSRLSEGGCPFWNADATWAARQATAAIVAAMRAAATAVGVEFLDLRHALDGHQLCDHRARRVGPEGPDPASAEWVRRLGFAPGSVRESLHPNAYGQRAIGACIAMHYARPQGDYACRGTTGRSYADGMGLERLN